MIVKGSTIGVYIYVETVDGLPATNKASSITGYYIPNGDWSSKVSLTGITFTELDPIDNAGWYVFQYTFNTEGTAFFVFSCTDCSISPWEDQIVDIATAVWTYDPSALTVATTAGRRLVSIQNTVYYLPSEQDIAEEVWTTTLSGVTPSAHSTYQKMLSIPADVWTNSVRSLTTRTVTYQGDTSEIASSSSISLIQNTMLTSSDITNLAEYGDSHWATATGFATSSDIPTSDIAAIKAKTDNLPSSPAAVGSAMTLTAAYDAAKTAAQSGDAMTLTAAAVTSVQAGLAKTTDIPTDDISAIKTKVNSLHNTDLTGIATTSNITTLWASTSTSISNLQSYGDSHWSTATGFASADDIPSVSSIAYEVWIHSSRSLTTAFIDDGSTTSHYFTTINDIPDIAGSVWEYGMPQVNGPIIRMSSYLISTYNNTSSISIPTVPTAGDIATSVWGYTIGNPAVSASTYLGSIGSIPQATWDYSWGNTVTSASVYLNSIYNNTSNITIPTPPTTGAIAASVWNYTDGTRGLTTSFYGTGDTSRFAVKDDIATMPEGITAADVWNYSIENISAINFVQGISTNTNTISVNTGNLATSYATIAGSIGTNTADITSIKASITNINTSIGSVNTTMGSITTSLGTIGNGMTSIASSVDYNKAALLNWSLSTASVLALHVGDTTTTYSIARDLAGNITGVSPN